MTVCSQCGVEAETAGAAAEPPDVAAEPPGVPPWGWMVERDRSGLVVATCPVCTRRHARAIEGKLDASWW